ncbi:monosaccharide ABC transporter membrane protein (CUT2 family) [Neobacillus bataviensis]|uniref:Monosaccharide ABC transporter membrane protein (CUT2 family) n=1 Tax=Neobacillus bataviensis TaxID=220685 RepID=A0A561D530_9BACI|nr:ABC transporter permease [Neobacillus bataviensis]TWD98531.1 monosaccharide ABC transporter membrane protein (CUT2 family) [Neobacillus bataviensis]
MNTQKQEVAKLSLLDLATSQSVMKRGNTGKLLAKYGIYIAFAILFVILSISSESFLTTTNIINILRQVSIIGIVAIGMSFVIITGGIDLSVGSIMALSAVVASSFAKADSSYSLIIPIMIGLTVGLACGLINGVLVAKWKVAPFIATLGMMTAARGLAMVYTNGRPVIGLNNSYNNIGSGYILGLPIPVIIFIFIVAIGIFLLNFTVYGRHVFATGGNEQSAKLSGIRVNSVKIGVYAIAGLLAGAGGMILSSRIMSGSPVLGQGYELDAIAAVVIGGTSLFGGVGSIVGTLIGVLIIGVMNNGLDLLNVSSYYQQILKGTIIVIAVLLDKKNQH